MSPSGEVVNVDGFWTEIITTSDAARLVQLTSIIQMNASLVGPVGIEPTTCGLKGSVSFRFAGYFPDKNFRDSSGNSQADKPNPIVDIADLFDLHKLV